MGFPSPFDGYDGGGVTLIQGRGHPGIESWVEEMVVGFRPPAMDMG